MTVAEKLRPAAGVQKYAFFSEAYTLPAACFHFFRIEDRSRKCAYRCLLSMNFAKSTTPSSHFGDNMYLSSKTIYENDWERHPQRVLISLLFPIWHTAIVSVIHYHGVHTLSMLLSSTSLVSLCRCPTPYRVSANLQAGLSCTTKIVTLHGKVYRMANWPSTIQVI